jgi:hypothetical protein
MSKTYRPSHHKPGRPGFNLSITFHPKKWRGEKHGFSHSFVIGDEQVKWQTETDLT